MCATATELCYYVTATKHVFNVFFFKIQDGERHRSFPNSRSRTSEEPHIGRYRLLKTIGKGNFAKVKLAKHLPTGKEVWFNFLLLYFELILIIFFKSELFTLSKFSIFLKLFS